MPSVWPSWISKRCSLLRVYIVSTEEIKFDSPFSEIKVRNTDAGYVTVPRLNSKGISRGVSFLEYVADDSIIAEYHTEQKDRCQLTAISEPLPAGLCIKQDKDFFGSVGGREPVLLAKHHSMYCYEEMSKAVAEAKFKAVPKLVCKMSARAEPKFDWLDANEPSDYRMQVVSQALLHLSQTAADPDIAILARLYHLTVCAEDAAFEELANDGYLLALTALAMESYPVPTSQEAFCVASDCVGIKRHISNLLEVRG